MPIIDMPVDLLLSRITRGANHSSVALDDLLEILPRLGCAVEELCLIHI